MKKLQILIIIFVTLTLAVLATGCVCKYFTDNSNPDNSDIYDTGDVTATSGHNNDTGDSQEGTNSSIEDTGDENDNNSSDANYGSNQNTDDSQNNDTGIGTADSGEYSDSGSGNDKIPQRYAIVVSGASYNTQHYTWFLNSTGMAHNLLKNNGYLEKNIYYLFESPGEPDVDYEATIKNFKKVIEELQGKTSIRDTIILFLIGHGTYNGTNSYYSLNDYNISDTEMAGMFKNIKRDKLIFIFSPCNSGGFVDDLSGKNTVVITSTQKNETNRAAFIEPILTSFDGTGDMNSDGKVSFAEAFNYASNNVSDQYINNNWGTITEHAQLDDNGDAISHEAPVPGGGDGYLAESIFLK